VQLEHLMLVLPNQDQSWREEMELHEWCRIIDQFGAGGGRELILAGSEPLLFPGFWVLARRGRKAKLSRVSAYFTGSLLEPWVMRELCQSNLLILIGLNSLDSQVHDATEGDGAHARVSAGLERLLQAGLGSRIGIVALATEASFYDLPQLAAWAAGRGLGRFLWSGPRLAADQKAWLANAMRNLSRSFPGETYIGPFDLDEDPLTAEHAKRSLRVHPDGETFWRLLPGGPRLGNLRYFEMGALLTGVRQATG
jgi:hypothetical protein